MGFRLATAENYDLEADATLSDAIRENVDPSVELVEIQPHVRDLGGERLSVFTHGDLSLFFRADDD